LWLFVTKTKVLGSHAPQTQFPRGMARLTLGGKAIQADLVSFSKMHFHSSPVCFGSMSWAGTAASISTRGRSCPAASPCARPPAWILCWCSFAQQPPPSCMQTRPNAINTSYMRQKTHRGGVFIITFDFDFGTI
jgi:hypothetical protein